MSHFRVLFQNGKRITNPQSGKQLLIQNPNGNSFLFLFV